jgi:NAD(P)-dependent dehydrogenase (short-subunit alcohol dehydrogenase family)
MKLENKVAIITGASEGIGKAMAERFVREGARVVLAARSEEKLRELARRLGEDRTLVAPTNVADPAQLDRLVAQTVEKFGGIDILVNNAGFGLYSPCHEMNWERFREMWEVNFFRRGAADTDRSAASAPAPRRWSTSHRWPARFLCPTWVPTAPASLR